MGVGFTLWLLFRSDIGIVVNLALYPFKYHMNHPGVAS